MDESTAPTRRWRDEHRHLSSFLETILEAAEDVGQLSHAELRKCMDEVDAFLIDRFLPDASAEEQEIYSPTLAAPAATELMIRDHAEIRRLAGKLEALRERLIFSYFGQAEVRSLQGLLYDLHAIIRLHLVKEDEIYLPLLDKTAGLPPTHQVA